MTARPVPCLVAAEPAGTSRPMPRADVNEMDQIMPVDADSFEELSATLERFVRERLIPREREIAGLSETPPDLLAEMAELGLFALTFPEEFGGLALDPVQEVAVGVILGRTTPAMRNLISIHNGVAGQALVNAGTPEQKAKWLPRMTSGEVIAAFALTEPEVGSDAKSVKSRARKVEGGWRITGTKRFISNATFAGLFTVVARTDAGGRDVISAFLVPADTPGLSVGKPEHKMGQHGAPIADLILDDCFVPDEALLGAKEGTGLKTALGALDRGRLFIAACCAGLAYRIIEDAADYAVSRVQFGVPIAEHQLIQAMIADSQTEAYAAHAMVEKAARKAMTGAPIGVEASMCKLYATEMVGRVADRGVQIHGGSGYISDYMIEQIYRDVRVLRIYEGTTQIQQLIIAKNVLARRAAGDALG